MALRQACITQSTYFFPIGNTPAVCLTDSLAPEIDAKILLLGCGDVRNILFTVYSGKSLDSRKLDFTCCDIEAEIIARNIVILTLIVEGEDGALSQHLWNIYYHVFLNKDSMKVLQKHVKSLLKHSQSLQNWNVGPYSSLVRFCDERTFKVVVEVWKLYATDLSSQQAYTTNQTLLRDQWKAAQDRQKVTMSGESMFFTVSAAAPVLIPAYADAEKLYSTFWSTGTCIDDKHVIRDLTIANPMFGCRRSGTILHYSQGPLSGFHLAPAYTQVKAGSPRASNPAEKLSPTSSTAFRIAFEQFAAWAVAYREQCKRVTIRFVNADAVAFSNVLQHQRTHNSSEDAHWYRDPWTFETLALDKSEYSQQNSAPTIFNVIDTSNLFDHLGGLNVLTAVAPLLEHTPSSTLRTEMMLPRKANVATSAEELICGDLPTVGSLLGLKPIQYWTNATMTWEMNESVMPSMSNALGSQQPSRISRPIILWKRLRTSSTRYNASELAQYLYGVYSNMFAEESWTSFVLAPGLLDRDLYYIHAGLISLLRCIKNSNIVDWSSFIRILMASIIEGPALNVSPHHMQSLCTQLDMFSLMPMVQMPNEWETKVAASELTGPFQRWSDIPPVVCVTLVVPREAVALFSKGEGKPQCQLLLHSSASEEKFYYPNVQMGFGTVDTTGEAFSDQYRINVTPGTKGWRGKLSLIVSAMVSTKSLVRHGDTAASVIFALRDTPFNKAEFSSGLDDFPRIHASNIGREDIFVTKYRPNMKGHMSVGSLTPPPPSSMLDTFTNVTIRPILTAKHVTSVQVRYDITSEAARQVLQEGAQVTVEQPGLFQLKLNIDSALQQSHDVPFPLNVSLAQVKIAREQSWIDVTAPVADTPFLAARPDNVFPVDMHSLAPLLEHLAYVVPETLPVLDVDTADWLKLHMLYPATMSVSEKQQFEMVSTRVAMPGRLGVKESLYYLFMHIAGLDNLAKSNWFSLNSPAGLVCVILVDSIRMDLSHQTVFIDAALLPPQASGGCDYITPFMKMTPDDAIGVEVNEDEAVFWRHLLPAFSERCRSWDHKSTCEYRLEGRLPISTEGGKAFICSCGNGNFPDEYLANIRGFETVKKFAVRVAVPAIFASSLSKVGAGLVDSSTTSADTQAIQLKKSCLKCGAATTKDGSPLLECSRCKTAYYCSRDCKQRDRKRHKQTCQQVQEEGVGADTA